MILSNSRIISCLTIPIVVAVALACSSTFAFDVIFKSDRAGHLSDMVMDNHGVLYLSDTIRGEIICFLSDGTEATLAQGLDTPTLLAVDNQRNIYVYLARIGTLARITPAGKTRIIARQLVDVIAITARRQGGIYILNASGHVRYVEWSQDTQ